jgi:hypothetical protein
MSRLVTSLAVVFLASCLNAQAATYYVDQTAGNDSNAGTSQSAPWKNSPGMSAYSGSKQLAPGDIVYFDRGDTWLVTGTQGLYLVGGVTYIGDTWGTGTRATIKASTDLDAGVVRFRDHATFETVLQGFNVDANGKVTTGIDMNSAFYLAPLAGATKRVQNCEVHNIWSRVALGQYKYGIHISDHGGNNGYVENVEILDTVVHDTSRDAINLYPGDESAACRIKNITVRHSEAYNTGQDPDYCCGAGIIVKGNVTDAFIEYNYVHDTKGAALFVNANETNHFAGVGQTNIHFRYNVVTNSTSNGAILIYDGPSGGDPKDIKVYGNIIYNSTANGGLVVHNGLKNTLSLLVYNNTFYNAPVVVENSNVVVNTFEFKNNILFYNNGTPLSDAGRRITAHSNNMFYRSSGTLVSSGGTNYTAGNLTTYEASGSALNPTFKNVANLPTGFSGTFGVNLAPNADGLSLQAGSFGLDHGIALAGTYAGAINSVMRPAGAAWDLGGYEAGSQQGVPPTAPTGLKIR